MTALALHSSPIPLQPTHETLAGVVHDLKLPLSHIKGFVSSLRRDDLEWDQASHQEFLADMLDVAVDRPTSLESTAQGAAFAAGWQAGLYPGPESFAEKRRRDRLFTPNMDETTRARRYRGWREAVVRAL